MLVIENKQVGKRLRREIIKYKPELKERAREFRNNATPMEKRLWKYLKGKKLEGFDFHRQRPVNNFIVDFYCSELKLAIEIDGSSHIGKEEADMERQSIIESFGITFLRFTNTEVENNTNGVIQSIKYWIIENKSKIIANQQQDNITKNNQSPTPAPPLERGPGGV